MLARQRLTAFVSIGVGAMFALAFLVRVDPVRTLVLRLLVPGSLGLLALLSAHGAATLLHAGLTRGLAALGLARVDGDPRDLALDEWLKVLVGAPLLGSLCFAVGCVSLSPAALALPLVLPALGSLGWLMRRRPPLFSPFAGAQPSLAALLVVAALSVGVLMAQLPPFTLDEVAYHLAVPRAYLLEGAVVELPLNSQSYFPFGVESLGLATMALAGPVGAMAHHFIVLGLALVTCLVAFGFLRRAAGLRAAWLGTAALGTTPALVLIAGTSWVDWALIGCAVSLLVSLASLSDEGGLRAERLAFVVLAAAAGTACKYTFAGVLAALFLGAAVAVRFERRSFGWLAAAAALGCLLGSTFMIRNLLWTGNPVAPFLDAGAPRVAGFHEEAGALQTLLGYVFEPGMADESVGGSLFALCAAFVIGFRGLAKQRFLQFSGLFSLLILLSAMLFGAAGRLLVPFATLAGLVGVVALGALFEDSSRLGASLRATLLLICGLQVLFAWSALEAHRPFSVLAPGRTDADYLASVRRNYAPIAWADERLPEGSKTLVLGTQELYWFRHRVRGAGNLDGPRLARYLTARDVPELEARLRRDGFTHVAVYHKGLVVGSGAERGRAAESVTVIDAHTANVLRGLLSQRGTSLGQQSGMSVHALVAAGGAP